MATIKPELKAILDRYGINPRDTSQVWDCHGVLVLYHKAYEVIAAKENIRFDPPSIIEANTEKKTVALLVTGHMGDRSEWSIGECAPANNKNGYVYAMAEKRAKDRVVAKLVGLAQYVYSEDEADEFKSGERAPAQQPPPKREAPAATNMKRDEMEEWGKGFIADIESARTYLEARELWTARKETLDAMKRDFPSMYGSIESRVKEISASKPKDAA